MIGYTIDVWKVVASNCRVSREEVKTALPFMASNKISQTLARMTGAGMLKQYDDGRYGVTKDCVVPMGISVEQVLEAAGVTV